jgi:lipid II:glycine glycyltransferase (peptidoglycan interpeptide bridge formation enzyme)
MTSTARAIERDPAASTAKTLRVQPKLDFELIKASRCSTQTLQEITEFLDTQETSHPFQWPRWSYGEEIFALLRCEGRIRWLAQCDLIYPASRLLKPIKALIVNRGPVCDDLEMVAIGLQTLAAEACKRKIAYIDIMPEWTGAFAGIAAETLARNRWQALSESKSSLRLCLKPSAEDLLASFRKTTRYEIRRATSQGIEVFIARKEGEYRDFLQLYSAMARQRKFAAERADLLTRVFHWLESEPGRGGLFLAREAGIIRGGALVLRFGGRSWYILGATSKDGSVGVGHLLQWKAIRWAKENGCVEYDFGGYREGATSGPALFKRGFCGQVAHFISSRRYIVNPGRYRALEAIGRVRRGLGVKS